MLIISDETREELDKQLLWSYKLTNHLVMPRYIKQLARYGDFAANEAYPSTWFAEEANSIERIEKHMRDGACYPRGSRFNPLDKQLDYIAHHLNWKLYVAIIETDFVARSFLAYIFSTGTPNDQTQINTHTAGRIGRAVGLSYDSIQTEWKQAYVIGMIYSGPKSEEEFATYQPASMWGWNHS